jgi:hypothetical protein
LDVHQSPNFQNFSPSKKIIVPPLPFYTLHELCTIFLTMYYKEIFFGCKIILNSKKILWFNVKFSNCFSFNCRHINNKYVFKYNIQCWLIQFTRAGDLVSRGMYWLSSLSVVTRIHSIFICYTLLPFIFNMWEFTIYTMQILDHRLKSFTINICLFIFFFFFLANRIHWNENLNLLLWIKLFNLLYIYLNKTEKFTGPNNVLLVLGRRTGAHRFFLFLEFWNCSDSVVLMQILDHRLKSFTINICLFIFFFFFLANRIHSSFIHQM